MADMIEELRKRQQGYLAAKSAVEGTKPKTVAIKRTEGGEEDARGDVTVIYDPANDTFTIQLDPTDKRCTRYMNEVPVADAKLIIAALNEFFEGVDNE
jgi:hypothetical protein